MKCLERKIGDLRTLVEKITIISYSRGGTGNRAGLRGLENILIVGAISLK